MVEILSHSFNDYSSHLPCSRTLRWWHCNGYWWTNSPRTVVTIAEYSWLVSCPCKTNNHLSMNGNTLTYTANTFWLKFDIYSKTCATNRCKLMHFANLNETGWHLFAPMNYITIGSDRTFNERQHTQPTANSETQNKSRRNTHKLDAHGYFE